MWKSLKALVAGLCLFVALHCGPVSAQTTKTALPVGQWTSLGAGPLFLNTIGQAWYAVSGTTPSLVLEGFPVPTGGIAVNTTQTVWARPVDNTFGATAYTFATVAGTFSGSFTWPGTAGLAAGGATTSGTMPYVNAYIAGTPTFNCGTGCGSLSWPGTAGNAAPGVITTGTMPYVNAVDQKAPDQAASSGSITVVDGVTTCGPTASFQTACTGVPTTGSTVLIPGGGSYGFLNIWTTLASGTVTAASLQIELTFDSTAAVNAGTAIWYGRGLFLDSNQAPVWHNSLPAPPWGGTTMGGGATYWRVRASTLTGSSPNITVNYRQGQATPFVYVGNLPTSANGTAALGSVAVQGGGSTGLPINTNLQEVDQILLGAPVAWGATPTGNVLSANVNCVVGCSASTVTSFAPTGSVLGTPLTPASASVSSVALPAGGTAELITNTGTVIGYVRLSVGSGTATANDIPIQPGSGCVLAAGSNTFINVYNATAGASINVASGTGLGSCPSGGGGGSGGSNGTPDAAISLGTAPSAANNFSTGLQVANYMSGVGGLTGYTDGGAELTGTCTANACMATSGFSGWNSAYVECTGGGTAGTNWYEIDTTGGSGGTVQKRQATFTGPTFSGVINVAAAEFITFVADQYSSGTLVCNVRGSQNFATQNMANGPLSSNFFSTFTANSSTTTELITGVAGLSIVVTGFNSWTDGGATAAGSVQLVAGTGATCTGGTPVNLGSPMNFSANNGLSSSGSVGQQFTAPPGYNLCLIPVAGATNKVYGNLTIAMK